MYFITLNKLNDDISIMQDARDDDDDVDVGAERRKSNWKKQEWLSYHSSIMKINTFFLSAESS